MEDNQNLVDIGMEANSQKNGLILRENALSEALGAFF